MNTSDDLTGLSHLAEPVRRRLYAFVAAQARPVTRDQAARATGTSRTLTAYHLDKLTDAGLLTADYARPEGRGGPGAGRPAKQYERADRELSVSVPARSYLLMAHVLARAVEADPSGQVRQEAARAARETGRLAGAGTPVREALQECGYEPHDGPCGMIEMHNCPFHQLVQDHTGLVCELNLDLVGGILEGCDDPSVQARLRPQDGCCCVVVEPTPST